MTKSMFYDCKHCDHEFELEIEATAPIPAQTYGPPEGCYPAEGGDFCILGDGSCPKCGTKVDEESARDKFWSMVEGQRYDD